jgi:hypothetical protein
VVRQDLPLLKFTVDLFRWGGTTTEGKKQLRNIP